jgi:hypothetical protein
VGAIGLALIIFAIFTYRQRQQSARRLPIASTSKEGALQTGSPTFAAESNQVTTVFSLEMATAAGDAVTVRPQTGSTDMKVARLEVSHV